MEEQETPRLNFDELHKEGLERKYFKKNAKNGVVITKPFSYTASHLYQLAAIARTEIVMSFLLMIPLIIMGILALVGIYKGAPSYITMGVELLGWIYFFSVTMRKLEVQRSLSIVNSCFDKSYKYQAVTTAVSFAENTRSLISTSGSSFSDSIGAIGGAVSLFCQIQVVNETINGIKTELKNADAGLDIKIKANRIKESHSARFILTIFLFVALVGAFIGSVYGYATTSKNAENISVIIGIFFFSFCLILVPNIVFQIKYIDFLLEAGQILLDAEKIPTEELEKFMAEKEEKEKNKKQKKNCASKV